MIIRVGLLVAGLILAGFSTASVYSAVDEPMNISVQLWSVRHDLKKDFDGTVDEVHPEKGKVKVMVSVFGRSTPVEVDFVHVNPIT